MIFKGNGFNSNIGRIEDITLPEINGNKSKYSREFGFGQDYTSIEDSSNEDNENEDGNNTEERTGGKKSSERKVENQMVLWSSINNEDFMFQGEDNEEILEQIEKIRLNVEKRKSEDREDIDHPLGEEIIEVVNEARNRGENKKRPRCLSQLDIDLRFKGVSSGNKNQIEMLVFNDEMIDGIDERLRGWDSYKWWQIEAQKSEKSQFLSKFQTLAVLSMRKSKRISASNQVENNIDKYAAIEKHRGEYNVGAEYNNADLGFDHFNMDEDFVGSPSNRRFRNSRDTIESSVNYYGESLNSSDGARLNSGRDSMIFSDSRRGSNTGIRLSTMLETGSVMSYNSSPFQFEKNLMGIQRDSLNSEMQRIAGVGRLNGSIASNGYGKQYRTNSIATSISDIFCMEEIKSSNWSKSGITTSSGTYNLKTYTVQKFIASRMKEIKEIKRINQENGYLIDKNNSNKENFDKNNIEGENSTIINDNKIIDFDDLEEETSIFLSELLPEKTVSKCTAAVFFYHLLVLATYNEIKLTQNNPGSNIKITKTSSFNEES